jgi:hypothetical protein
MERWLRFFLVVALVVVVSLGARRLAVDGLDQKIDWSTCNANYDAIAGEANGGPVNG